MAKMFKEMMGKAMKMASGKTADLKKLNKNEMRNIGGDMVGPGVRAEEVLRVRDRMRMSEANSPAFRVSEEMALRMPMASGNIRSTMAGGIKRQVNKLKLKNK